MNENRYKNFIIYEFCRMSGNAKPILNVMAIIFTLALAMFYVGVTLLKEVVGVQNFFKVQFLLH